MAYLEGTLEEIYKYLGPRTSDIVSQLARPYRKNKYGRRVSCGELLEDGTKCKQYTGLHAAHLKGRERKVLIQEILKDFAEETSVSTYKIELDVFEREFEKKHLNFLSVIKFMCPKHHKQYDTKLSKDLEDIYVLNGEEWNEIVELKEFLEEENVAIDELLNTHQKMSFKELKIKLARQYNVPKHQISIANQSVANQLWNFDVLEEKFQQNFIFVFLLPAHNSCKIVKVDANKLDIYQFTRKGKNKLRFKIDDNLIEEKGFDFTPFTADISKDL